MSLPDDLLLRIFHLLNACDLVLVSRCCRSFKRIAQSLIYSVSYKFSGISVTGDVPNTNITEIPGTRSYLIPDNVVHTFTLVKNVVWALVPKNWLNPYCLNMETHVWRRQILTGDPPKQPRHNYSCISIQEKLWLFGGLLEGASVSEENSRCNDVHVLDIETGSWSHVECMNPPPPVCLHSAVFKDTKMFIFGGMGSDGKLYALDIESHNWTAIETTESSPSPRIGNTFNLVGDKIWMFGGSSHSGVAPGQTFNDMHVFDISSSLWSKVDVRCLSSKFPVPSIFTGLQASVPDDGSSSEEIFFFGRSSFSAIAFDAKRDDIWVLYTRHRCWRQIHFKGNAPPRQDYHTVLPYKGDLYAFAGSDVGLGGGFRGEIYVLKKVAVEICNSEAVSYVPWQPRVNFVDAFRKFDWD